MTQGTPPSVKIEVLKVSFFRDDSLLQRIRRSNQGIKDYLDKVPDKTRKYYRIHLQAVTPKQAAYDVFYYRGQ